MKPKLIEDWPGEWVVQEPKSVEEHCDAFWEGVELMNSDPILSEKKLKQVIRRCPEGHIDAILHLGYLKNRTGNPIEGSALIFKAHSIALDAIPRNFDENKGEIHWGVLENRPFLRTFEGIGYELMEEGNIDKAIEKFQFVLKVNPNDNQGLRYSLMECYFQQKKPESVLALYESYQGDWSIDFNYGAVLASLQLGRKKEAVQYLEKALQDFPKGGKEIIKKRHTRPKDGDVYGGVILGSAYEAYDYWQRNGRFWKGTDNAVEFVRDNMK